MSELFVELVIQYRIITPNSVTRITAMDVLLRYVGSLEVQQGKHSTGQKPEAEMEMKAEAGDDERSVQ